jgi:hypothetical protein
LPAIGEPAAATRSRLGLAIVAAILAAIVASFATACAMQAAHAQVRRLPGKTCRSRHPEFHSPTLIFQGVFMTIIRLALALGVAAVATNQYMKNRRKTRSAGSDGQIFNEDMSSRDDTPLDGAANRAAVEGTTAAGSDSPNSAERLQAEGLADTTGSTQGSDDLLRANGQDGSDGIQPGLPDLTRGA